MRTYYFAVTDENGVLCVDQVDEYSQPPSDQIQRMAEVYTDTNYFEVAS